MFSESIVIHEDENENFGGNMEIITLGANLEDGIVKSTQNSIRDQLRRDKLVKNGHAFELNVNQIYIPTEGKYQF